MTFGLKLGDFSVSAIAKRGIGAHFTRADFIVSTFVDIEVNGSIASGESVAHEIAPRIIGTDSARAKPVNLRFFQVQIIWVVTTVQWDTRRPVLAFIIWNGFWKRHCLLGRKVSHVVRGFCGSYWWRNKHLRRNSVGIVEVDGLADYGSGNYFVIFSFS